MPKVVIRMMLSFYTASTSLYRRLFLYRGRNTVGLFYGLDRSVARPEQDDIVLVYQREAIQYDG